MPSASIRSRTSAPTCCTYRTAAFCVPAACASWKTWPRSPCSMSPSGATGPTSGSIPRRGSTIRGPATSSICARSARSSPTISCTRHAPGGLSRTGGRGAGLDWTGAVQIVRGEAAPLAGVPNLALRPERAPNGTAAELLGYGRDYAAALKAAESAAVVLVLDEPEVTIRTAGALIYLGTALPAGARDAEVVLPLANLAEGEGTFVKRGGRVQRYFQAKPAPGMARPAWWVLAELLAALGRGESLAGPDPAFDRLARSVGPFAGLSYASLGALGKPINAGVGAGATA